MVFCEFLSTSFLGVMETPTYTYLTCCTSDYVKNGVNGRSFVSETSAVDIAKNQREG